jgi:hypothetical protein
VSPRYRWILLAIVFVLVPLGASAWYLFRVEDIPETLDPVELDPDDIVIPHTGDGPSLAVAQLRGKTAFFVMVGAQTGRSAEGERLNRALNRWVYPDTTVGYVIGDAEGFGLLHDRISDVMGHYAQEVRYPLYVDYEGAFINTFNLPKGHHGFVVLGPDGEVEKRRSGGIDDPAEIERIRQLLGAEEPPAGPPAPDFELGALSDEACGERPCAIVFAAEPVRLEDVPGSDEGFAGDDEARFAQMKKPHIRNVQLGRRMHLDHALGTMVGDIDARLRMVGWTITPQADAAREAFGIAAGESALVVIADGKVAINATGSIPLYRFGLAADLLRVEGFNDRRPPKE